MPRNPSGTYTVPPGTAAATSTVVASAPYNAFVADIEADLNAVRPQSAGGTGASTADAALTAFGGTTVGKALFKAATPADAQSTIRAELPAGAVMQFAMTNAPSGWLKANGQAVSRVTYASLFAAIGVSFGAGDGATTFNVPDFRGEFLRAWDDGRGIDAGRAMGSAQAAEMLNHTHAVTLSTDGDHRHRVNGSIGGSAAVLGSQTSRVSGIGFGQAGESFTDSFGGARHIENAGAHTHTATVGNPSAGGGTETRPRNVALLVCIKH